MFLTVGQVFSCRCGEGFRSLCVHCFFGTHSPANVLRAFSGHALNNPGSRRGKSPLRGPFALCRLPVGSGPSLHPCRPSPPPASLRAAPVSRQRLIDFHAGPTASLQFSAFQVKSFRCKKANCGDGQVWMGPAENCRRVSGGPGEPAGMRVQGARSRDAESRPTR